MSTAAPTLNDTELLKVLSLSHNATAVYTTENLIIETANDAMLAFWGKNRSVIGQALEDAVPALQNNPLLDLLKNVWRTGQTYQAQEVPVQITQPEKRIIYFDFEYRAIKRADGQMYCILHTAANVTDRTLKNKAKVDYSNYRLEQMVMTSPVAMTILRGRELVVEIANEAMLAVWMRSRQELIGRSVLEIFPEISNQPFPELLYSIFDTGQPVSVPELAVEIADKKGVKSTYYRNFSYNPIFDSEGRVESVLAIVIDITQGVLARKKAETNEAALQTLNEELASTNEEFETMNEELAATNKELEATNNEFVLINEELSSTNEELALANEEIAKNRDTLNLAIDAAGIITWRTNLGTGEFSMSDNGEPVFETVSRQSLTFSVFLDTIGAGHRERINHVINKAIADKKKLDIEFHLKSAGGQKNTWFKLNALPYYNTDGTPSYLTGTLLNITEQKEDDQRKNDFIAMVSHELKTPLTSLKAYLQLMNVKAKGANDNFSANALEKSNLQVNKMTTLINGFLNLSRLESGKINLDKKPFELDKLIAEIVEENLTTTYTHSIALNPCDAVLVNADADKIGSVVNNLLSNAVKYSPKGTTITIKCTIDNNTARVSVKDEGIGVSEKDIARLFDRFYRVEGSETQTISGFGIGLYLSAEIIHRHDGHIWVKSEPGKGSTFYFTLPLYDRKANLKIAE